VRNFAQNDGAKDKPDRYTTHEEYDTNLIRMVRDVRKKGAIPILCTSVMRRKFDAASSLIDTYGMYPVLTRKVAKEWNVLFLDMQKSMTKWLEVEGAEASATNFHQIAPGVNRLFSNGLNDNTHFCEKGARKADSLFVE
jgi:hypothetical protein